LALAALVDVISAARRHQPQPGPASAEWGVVTALCRRNGGLMEAILKSPQVFFDGETAQATGWIHRTSRTAMLK
jgi:hypothetical protein